jgi:hypothetical protein
MLQNRRERHDLPRLLGAGTTSRTMLDSRRFAIDSLSCRDDAPHESFAVTSAGP